MAEKIIKTKIALRQETYAYWTDDTATAPAKKEAGAGTHGFYVPRYGEVCFCEITAANQGTQTTPPTVLFKVGNGKDYFKDLNWASALAADVYDWAKKSLEEFTGWVAKTPKAVTLTVNNVSTDYSIEDAIKLVRSEIAAGGTAATITIADQSTAGKVKYVAKQGGVDIVEAIEINEGTGINISVVENVPVISHQAKPTTGNAVTATTDTATGNTFITEVAIDSLGHVAGVKSKTVTIPDSPSISIGDKTQTDTENLVYAVTNLKESGTLNHTITPTYKAVPTQKYVDEKVSAAVAGAVDYLGLVNNANELSTAAGKATHGDFVRVATAFSTYHVNDLLIYNKPEGVTTAIWDVIHGEEGDIVAVTAGSGLTGGGASGEVTLNVGAGNGITVEADKVSAKAGNHITVNATGINHGAKPTTGTAQSATAGTGRTYVTEVLVDSYGHIAGVKTATESVTNTDTWRNINVFAGVDGSKTSVSLKGTGITTGPLNLKAGTGLKWTATANSNDATVDIDDTVTFILDCNL